MSHALGKIWQQQTQNRCIRDKGEKYFFKKRAKKLCFYGFFTIFKKKFVNDCKNRPKPNILPYLCGGKLPHH